LFLDSTISEFKVGEQFEVKILADTEEESINIAEIGLHFNPDLLEVIDFADANSIFSLWLKKPDLSNDDGNIFFIGGTPGGYSGNSGLLGRLFFKVKSSGEVEISFTSITKMLLNDGFGTAAVLDTQGLNIILSDKTESPIEGQWEKEISADIIPPEPFVLEIGQNDNIFDGKYFIAFSASDKQTGVDYYAVKEGLFGQWKKVSSPYILSDQQLTSKIQVMVVDKAGNKRIAILPAKYVPWWKNELIIVVIIAIIILCVFWATYILKNKRKKIDQR